VALAPPFSLAVLACGLRPLPSLPASALRRFPKEHQQSLPQHTVHSSDFSKGEEFGPRSGQALGFEEKVAQIGVAAPSPKQSFDVAVDGFHAAEPAPEGSLRLEDLMVEFVILSAGPFRSSDGRVCELALQALDPQPEHGLAHVSLIGRGCCL